MRSSVIATAGPSLVVVIALAAPAPAQWVEDECESLLTIQGGAGTLFAWDVATMGDVNDDGVPDIAVAAPFFLTNRGRVTVHSGADGSELWGFTGPLTSAILGFSLTIAPDLDGDGIDDVISGAPFSPGTGGFVYVFSGADGQVVHRFQGEDSTYSIGYSVSADGDFNGDGVLDIVISDTGYDGGREVNDGRVLIFSSDDFSLVTTIEPPMDPVNRFGTGTQFIDDISGDGLRDLVVGERLEGESSPGRLQVFSWDGARVVHEYTIDDLVEMPCSLCGDFIEGGRDVTGDGVPDIVLAESAPGVDRVRIFSGDDGRFMTGWNDDVYRSATIIDDTNGDGVADVVLGAADNSDGAPEGGKIYVRSGVDKSIIAEMTSTIADAGVGSRVRAFDHDGDGDADIVAGAVSSAGRVFVVAGPPGPLVGDLDDDGDVDFEDLIRLLASWGPCDDCPEDLDGNGTVGFNDVIILLANWT